MKRSLVIAAMLAGSLSAASPALTRSYDAATDAWERGEYRTALTGFIQIVSGPGGDAFIEPIALTTGELFETRELTPDGRAPRFSPDRTCIAYETGLEISPDPDLVYLVSSHYDSVEVGPGADDDSSGTAALLEAARVLADHPLPATVVFASFTGEEGGLLGSREFVRRALAGKMRVVGALNNDMVGWVNDGRLDNTIRYSNPGIRDIQHGAAMLFTRLITYDARYFKGTDAASLYDAYGDVVGGIGSYPVLGSPQYHQASDRLEFENHQLIMETSKATVATVMLLASSPSRLTNLKVESYTGTAATLSWTPGIEQDIAAYLVASGPAVDPMRHRVTVTRPRITLPQIAAGTRVSVKAVNARGLEGWDWASTIVGEPHATRMTQ